MKILQYFATTLLAGCISALSVQHAQSPPAEHAGEAVQAKAENPSATRVPPAAPPIFDPAKQIPPEIVPDKQALERCGALTVVAEREQCFKQYPPPIKGR